MNGKIGNWTILIQRNVKEKNMQNSSIQYPAVLNYTICLISIDFGFVQNACVSKIIKTLYLPII